MQGKDSMIIHCSPFLEYRWAADEPANFPKTAPDINPDPPG